LASDAQVRRLEALDVRQPVGDPTAEEQEGWPRAGAPPPLQGTRRKPPSLCKLVLEQVRPLGRENRLFKVVRPGQPRPRCFEKAGHFAPRAISARMSSTRQAVILGPSLIGFG
jgi:hypothetical protein